MPCESRSRCAKAPLAKADNVKQLANNLIIRRALAGEAEAAGLANDPAIQGAIRDRPRPGAVRCPVRPHGRRQQAGAKAVDRPGIGRLTRAIPSVSKCPEETGARHILIKLDTPDAKAKAEQILAELKAGADFDKLAKEQSQDPGARPEAVTWATSPPAGWFRRSRRPFSKLQKPGELSDVVETQFGYHIIKLEGRRPAGIRPFEQVKDVLHARSWRPRFLTDKRWPKCSGSRTP